MSQPWEVWKQYTKVNCGYHWEMRGIAYFTFLFVQYFNNLQNYIWNIVISSTSTFIVFPKIFLL